MNTIPQNTQHYKCVEIANLTQSNLISVTYEIKCPYCGAKPPKKAMSLMPHTNTYESQCCGLKGNLDDLLAYIKGEQYGRNFGETCKVVVERKGVNL